MQLIMLMRWTRVNKSMPLHSIHCPPRSRLCHLQAETGCDVMSSDINKIEAT
jgi:hypothetical protein